MPFHLLHQNILAKACNSVGCFIKVDMDRLEKGIVMFARICVEVNRTSVLPNNIFLQWNGLTFMWLLDYENTPLCCRLCQQPSNLQNVYPFSKGCSPPSTSKNKPRGWNDRKVAKESKKSIINQPDNP